MPPETLELREASSARLAALLRRQAAAFDRLARQAAARLTDDRVHRLRVLTRRLRSAVSVARRFADHPALDELRRRLRRVGRALGRRRSLDVARADHAALDGGAVPERLETGRAQAAEAVVRQLRPGRRARIASAAREAAAAVGRRGAPGRALARWLGRRTERLDRAWRAATSEDKEAQHRLRIEAKKVRYVLEVLRDTGSAPFAEADRRLRSLQRALGRAHDYEVLLGLVDDGAPLRDAARRAEERHRRRGAAIARPAVRAAAAALARAARRVADGEGA